MRVTWVALLSILALASSRAALAGAAPTDPEQRAIEALISSVARAKDATFVRNGQSYSASAAARFLREKWPIRFADGREISNAEFLGAELAERRLEEQLAR